MSRSLIDRSLPSRSDRVDKTSYFTFLNAFQDISATIHPSRFRTRKTGPCFSVPVNPGGSRCLFTSNPHNGYHQHHVSDFDSFSPPLSHLHEKRAWGETISISSQ